MADKYAILSLDDAALLSQCRIDVFVGTGRGGQKRNKTSSAVRLTHLPTGLVVTDDTSRSQHQNRGCALRKLRQAIALTDLPETPGDPPPPPAIDAIPSEKSAAYPHWLASIHDLLVSSGYDIPAAAEAIGCSPSKLTKVLQRHPLLWQSILHFRQQRVSCPPPTS